MLTFLESKIRVNSLYLDSVCLLGPLLPPLPKSDKIAWKRINNPPNTPLINFLVDKLPTISHTIIGAIETGNDRAYLKKIFASINIHSQPHIHSHRIPHSPNSSSNLPKHHLSIYPPIHHLS